MLKITGRQIRMARIALKWRVDDLAKESDVTWARLQTMERSDDLLEFSEKIQKIVNTFKKHKIGVRKVWYPNHLQKPYKNFQRYNIHNANLFYKNCLCIPSGLELKIKDLNKIIEIFHS